MGQERQTERSTGPLETSTIDSSKRGERTITTVFATPVMNGKNKGRKRARDGGAVLASLQVTNGKQPNLHEVTGIRKRENATSAISVGGKLGEREDNDKGRNRPERGWKNSSGTRMKGNLATRTKKARRTTGSFPKDSIIHGR